MKIRIRKGALIASLILLILGISSAAAGIVISSDSRAVCPPITAEDVSPEKLGSDIRFSFMSLEALRIKSGAYVVVPEDGDETVSILLVPEEELLPKIKRKCFGTENIPVNVRGTVSVCSEELIDEGREAVKDYLIMMADVYGIEPSGDSPEIKAAMDSFSPVCIRLTGLEGEKNVIIFFIAGAALAVSAVLAFLCAFFGAKNVIVTFAAFVVISGVILAVLLKDRVRSMNTINKVTDGFYTMSFYGSLNTDDYLNADISTVDEMIGWISRELYFGISTENIIDPVNFGCSAFLTANGLMGRNFDYGETDAVLVYTAPEGDHASFGMADMRFFGVGEGFSYSPGSIEGKALMLSAPFVVMDGINDAGVGVSILQLDIDENHQDNGKPDMLIYIAIRGILDKCASVDEALGFLEKYDIHTALGRSYHLFIADKSGRSVVVEWFGNEMIVNEDNACTNFVISDVEQHMEGSGIDNYEILKAKLSEMDGILDKDTAMRLLSEVSWETGGDEQGTEWSCVYGLDDLTLDICLDGDYERVFSFTGQPLK